MVQQDDPRQRYQLQAPEEVDVRKKTPSFDRPRAVASQYAKSKALIHPDIERFSATTEGGQNKHCIA
jgi:hypothetical protein